MVDTIILNIPFGHYRIDRPENFNPPATNLSKGGGYMKYTNNPTKQDVGSGVYKPRLTLYKRWTQFDFKIEFSAPKVIFRNNLQELVENQFDDVVAYLHKKVFDMGVFVSEGALKRAPVSAFHPSKNILITGGYTARQIIGDFSKISLTEKMDFDYKTYRNNGHCLQLYARTHALTFYDKIQDLEKPEKRSLGKDQKAQQQSLFDFLQKKTKLEILRMEARLCDKRKMNSVLTKLGYKENPTFADIFKKEICQKILLDYFTNYIEPNLFIFDYEDTPQKIFKTLLKNNPTMRPATAFQLTGLKQLCKEKGGVRDLRRMLGKKASERSWDRIAKKIKVLNKTATIENCQDYIKQIKTALQQFKPYTLPQATKIEPPKSAFDPMSLH